MTNSGKSQTELPGLELDVPVEFTGGPMSNAMKVTAAHLEQLGCIHEEHQAQITLALLMASVVDRAMDARTKVYAAVNAGHEMHEQIMALPMLVQQEDAGSVDREIAVLLGRLPQ